MAIARLGEPGSMVRRYANGLHIPAFRAIKKRVLMRQPACTKQSGERIIEKVTVNVGTKYKKTAHLKLTGERIADTKIRSEPCTIDRRSPVITSG